MRILAIDPGNEKSAYVLVDENYKPIEFAILPNDEMLDYINNAVFDGFTCEMVASYGMAVGKTVFETCVWIGRFIEAVRRQHGTNAILIYRKDIKMNICYQTKAKDANIRQALIDRFGVVGTKKDPGFFYGFKADIWAAFALAVTYLDNKYMNKTRKEVDIYGNMCNG